MTESGSSSGAPELLGLSEQETEKMTQFKDLTGIEQTKCLQILRANDWNLEVALDLTLDGAYNEDQTIYNSNQSQQSTPSSSAEAIINSSQLRHRNLAANASSGNNNHDVNAPNPFEDDEDERADTNDEHHHPHHLHNHLPRNQDENPAGAAEEPAVGLHMVLWNSATWLLKLPFIIVLNTLNTFYDFFATLIRPTLNYDATGTVERFIGEFEEAYGQTHPTFYRGSYTSLLEEGKRDIRFLLLYLHSPSHRDTDRFCSEVLATQTFADFVTTEHLLFWGCSVNYPEGYKVWQALRVGSGSIVGSKGGPFLALVGLKNHRMVAMKRVEGFYNLTTLTTILKTAIANNEASLIATRVDREERQAANLIRAQQDAAFEESLRVDREKERKRLEAAEKAAEEARLKKAEEEAIAARAAALASLKESLKGAVPPEEEDNSSSKSTFRLLFRLPDGSRLERRFRSDDPVRYLYYYVFSSTPSKKLLNFKICTTYPSRQLPGHSPTPESVESDAEDKEMCTPLVDCGLENNYVLFVYDLDS